MKRAILIAILAFAGLTARAGNNLPYIKMGIKVGYTSQKYRLSSDIDGFKDKLEKAVPAYHAGITVRINMTRIPLYIQGEAVYEGMKTDNGNKSTLKTHNISVPLLVGTEMELAGIGLRVNTGPVITILTSTKLNGKEDPGWNDLLTKPISWCFGAGVDIWKLTFDVRYNMGLAKKNTEMKLSGTETKKITSSKINSWTFGVGILF